MNLPVCPECQSEYTYQLGDNVACSICGYEWNPEQLAEASAIRDAVGNTLTDGDHVTVIRDLRLKSGGTIKSGTKVRGIRLLDEPIDGHDIDAKVDGFGSMRLKSSVVKKA